MADIVANGVRLNHLRLGEGDETVVFVHGLVVENLSVFYFRMAPKVALHAEVVLYDLRGHGRSERPPAGYSVSEQVDDLLALLDELEIDRPVHLVAHSFGGVIALETAVRHPDRVASLFMIEGLYAVEGWAEQMVGNLDEAIFGLRNDDMIEWFEQRRSRKLNRFAANTDELLSHTTLLDDLKRTVPLTTDDLESLRCPVVALYGDDSDMLGRGLALERHAPRCQLHVLPGVSHFILMEAGKFVEYYLLDLLGIPAEPPSPDTIVPFDFWKVRAEGNLRAADALEQATEHTTRTNRSGRR